MICSICTEEITNASWLPCCHVYCKDCIDVWTVHHPSCPICRYDLNGTALRFCIDIDEPEDEEMPELISESEDEEPPPLEVDDDDDDDDYVPFN